MSGTDNVGYRKFNCHCHLPKAVELPRAMLSYINVHFHVSEKLLLRQRTYVPKLPFSELNVHYRYTWDNTISDIGLML